MRRMARDQAKSATREYRIWVGMWSRCSNEKQRSFRDYGEKGIRVCARWRTFENFFADMGPCPDDRMSIDRESNACGYSCGKCADCIRREEPSNCRWATSQEQATNKLHNRPKPRMRRKPRRDVIRGLPKWLRSMHARMLLDWENTGSLYSELDLRRMVDDIREESELPANDSPESLEADNFCELDLLGSADDGDGMTLEEVGEAFGLTRERIRQIEALALKKLRAGLEATPKRKAA